MKTALALIAVSSLIFASVSCDKHSWAETEVLHEGMHKDHHGEEAHGEKAHGEVKAEAHAPTEHAAEKKEEAKH
ncbi:MAG: hypothetical protein OJI67_11975 [Prosthecobacter sp.]|nr:hypothetical protein [Prosthecobacter sp.]